MELVGRVTRYVTCPGYGNVTATLDGRPIHGFFTHRDERMGDDMLTVARGGWARFTLPEKQGHLVGQVHVTEVTACRCPSPGIGRLMLDAIQALPGMLARGVFLGRAHGP